MQIMTMQSEWDLKGKENPYYWSVTSNKDWHVEDFYATGERDVATWIVPLFVGKDTASMSALDIGAATGRMTRHFPFGEVLGVDISPSMIARARKDNPTQEYRVTNGLSLNGIPSEYFDFVFSYSTLSHLPQLKYLGNMLKEIHRVMKKGGTARINVRAFPGNSRGTILWWKSFNRFWVAITKFRGVPVPYVGFFNAQHGVSVTERQLLALASPFSHAKTWRSMPRNNLWIDLIK